MKEKSKQEKEFSSLGVKIGFLKKFIEDQTKAGYNFQGKTTKQVVDEIICREKELGNQSYCQMLQKQRSPYVGKANVFISHAWDDYFLELVKKLQNPHNFHSLWEVQYYLWKTETDHEEEKIIWLDIFSNNQNADFTNNQSFDWWCQRFQDSIKEINQVVIILTPISITRGWCIWEIYCAIAVRSWFYVAVATVYEKKNEGNDETSELASHYFSSSLYALILLWKCNSQLSKCGSKEDESRIHAKIVSSGGFKKIDWAIILAVCKFILNPFIIFCIAQPFILINNESSSSSTPLKPEDLTSDSTHQKITIFLCVYLCLVTIVYFVECFLLTYF